MEKENKIDYLIVKCNNEECFYDLTKLLYCAKCPEGKLIDICFNCEKENEIKDSTWLRIDCECGACTIPCSKSKYKLIKNE